MKKRVLVVALSLLGIGLQASTVNPQEWGSKAGSSAGSVIGCACGVALGGTLGGSIFSEEHPALQSVSALSGIGLGAKYGWVVGKHIGAYVGDFSGRMSVIVAQKMKALKKDLQENGIASESAAVIAGSVFSIAFLRYITR